METYEVQKIEFGEYTPNVFDVVGAKFTVVYHGTYEDCLTYWEKYASGKNDYEGVCANQNFSSALFYRIVQAGR